MTRRFRSVFPFALAVATTCSTFAVGQETTQSNSAGQSTGAQTASESQNSSDPQQDSSQSDQQTGSQGQNDGDTSNRVNSSQYADDDIRSSDAFNDSQRSQPNRSGSQSGRDTQDTDVQYGDSQNNDDAQRPQQRSQQYGNRQQGSRDQNSTNDQGSSDDRDGAIGVQLEPQSQGNGVRVTGVYRNSPAAQAGIRVGDRILRVAGRTVTNAQDVVRFISQREPNQTLIMTIQSANGQREDLALRLSSRAEELQGRMTQQSRGGGQMGSPMYQGSRNQGNPPIMQMLAEIRNELRQVRARLDSLEGRGRSTSYRQQQSGFNGGNNSNSFEPEYGLGDYQSYGQGNNQRNGSTQSRQRSTDANRNQRIENTYGNQQFDRSGFTDDGYFDRQDDFYEDRNEVFDRNDAGVFDGERRSGFGNRRMIDE